MYTDRDRTLALAGMAQAATLTRSLARRGSAPAAALEASVRSIFALDPPDVPAVYGGEAGVASGLQALVSHLTQPQQQHRETTGYLVALLQLERQLAKAEGGLARLGKDLAALQQRLAQHQLSEATRYAALADIYQSHISRLSPRIMVKGEPLHLNNPDTAARIRTMLLAGIRAAHLWRQCGGRRWQLLTARRRIIRTAQALLQQLAGATGVL